MAKVSDVTEETQTISEIIVKLLNLNKTELEDFESIRSGEWQRKK